MDALLPGLSSAQNLHPMMVHFPIVFWLAAAGAWAVALLRRNDTTWRFGLWLHTLGLAGAALSVALGFWATDLMGHDSPGHDLVHVHRDFMLVATGVAVLITVIGWWKRAADNRWRVALVISSMVLVGVMTLGADRGAELVFRYGFGVANEAPSHAEHDHGHGDGHGAQALKGGGDGHAPDTDHPPADHVAGPERDSARPSENVPAEPLDPSSPDGDVRSEEPAPPAQTGTDRPASDHHDHDHGGHEH